MVDLLKLSNLYYCAFDEHFDQYGLHFMDIRKQGLTGNCMPAALNGMLALGRKENIKPIFYTEETNRYLENPTFLCPGSSDDGCCDLVAMWCFEQSKS